MRDEIPTAGVLVFNNGEVLLVRHTKESRHPEGSYGIPAGRVNKNERGIDAALRELQEETGLITYKRDLVKVPIVFSSVLEREDGPKRFTIEFYVCQSYRGSLRESSEAIPEWVSRNNLRNLKLLPNVEEMVRAGSRYYNGS